MKEAGMMNQFEKRFEEQLQKIYTAIHKKEDVKKLDKVHQRIGRAKEKYPSVGQYYIIEVTADKKTNQAIEMTWKKDQAKYDDKKKPGCLFFTNQYERN